MTAPPHRRRQSRRSPSSPRAGSFRLQLSVINADGSGERRLAYLGPWVAHRAHFLASRPAWSPDGRRIAYAGVRDDGNLDIYVVRVDGRGRRRLTRPPFSADDGNPVWSPDGRKLAFTRQEGFYEFDIYVMNADGSGQRRLTRNGWLHFSVAWSPDGRKMLFERPDLPRTDAEELWMMNADGSGQRRLTRNPARDGNPSWSPDGHRIVSRGNGRTDTGRSTS